MFIKPLPPLEELRRCLAYDDSAKGLIWIARSGVMSPVVVGSVAAWVDAGAKYKRLSFRNSRYLEHRVIWALHSGYDSKLQIDHINGDTMDNQPSNLREATHGQNIANARRPVSSKSPFKGASYHKRFRKWTAQIGGGGTQRHLGYFDTPEEAHAAYVEAAQRLFGEFARAG
jgi:hypothetical protein